MNKFDTARGKGFHMTTDYFTVLEYNKPSAKPVPVVPAGNLPGTLSSSSANE